MLRDEAKILTQKMVAGRPLPSTCVRFKVARPTMPAPTGRLPDLDLFRGNDAAGPAIVAKAFIMTDLAAQIGAALAEAYIPSLLMSLVHLNGDLSLLTPELRPEVGTLIAAEREYSDAQQAEIRELAADKLRAHLEAEAPLPDLGMDRVEQMIRYLIGDGADDSYIPFLEEEIGVGDFRKPDWGTPLLRRCGAHACGHHRCGHVRPARRHPPATGGNRLYHPRGESGRRRHMV
jgi:hypothetical protein